MAFPGTSRFTRVTRSVGVALVLTTALSVAACASPASPAPGASDGASEDAGSLRIGFSPFTLQVPALKGLADALTGVAGSQGDTVITADPKGDPSTQLQQIQQWVQLDQVDAIWVIPASAEAVASALVEAQAKGIVVLASGVPEDYGFDGPQAGITFSNVDNVDYGTQLGDLTAKCITDRLDGKGEVIFLRSPQGQQSSSDIADSFKAALASGAPDATLANEQEAGDRLASQQTVSSALQAAPDANTVVGTDDEASLGALDAFGQAGKDPATTCIIGAGGNEEAVKDVTDGKLFGVVAFDFETDLGQNLTELHKLAEDPKADGQQLTTPIKVFTE